MLQVVVMDVGVEGGGEANYVHIRQNANKKVTTLTIGVAMIL